MHGLRLGKMEKVVTTGQDAAFTPRFVEVHNICEWAESQADGIIRVQAVAWPK